MFRKKTKKRSEWLEGLLLAERIINYGGSEEQVHVAIGSQFKKIPTDPRGLIMTFWEAPKNDLSDGAMSFLNFIKRT